MTTPTRLSTRRSLRQRVTTSTLAVAAIALLVVEAATFLLYRQLLEEQVDDTLDARVALTAALAQDFRGEDLAERLEAIGVRATIVTPDGTVTRSTPSLPRVPRDLPAPGADPDPTDLAADRIKLPDGSTATVFVLRTGVDQSLRRLLLIEAAVTAAALAGIVLAARHAARRALQPIDIVIDYAGAVSGGDRQQRLAPDDPTTEIGRLAAAVDTMVHDLRSAEDELRQQIDAGRRFTADAAHQLRTPLTGLRVTIDLLGAHPDNPRNPELLDSAGRECQRAARLIDRLLTLARLDQHHATQPATTVDLGALLDHEADRIGSIRPDLTVTTTSMGREVLVDGTPDDLAEAFANLLDNARQNAATIVAVTVDAKDTTVHTHHRRRRPHDGRRPSHPSLRPLPHHPPRWHRPRHPHRARHHYRPRRPPRLPRRHRPRRTTPFEATADALQVPLIPPSRTSASRHSRLRTPVNPRNAASSDAHSLLLRSCPSGQSLSELETHQEEIRRANDSEPGIP